MTERLADISARIGGIQQLGAVVSAMRGIAAARVQQAGGQLAAVDRYAAVIASAIARALVLAPAARPGLMYKPGIARKPARPALVLFCAEQGFAGAFSGRVLDSVGGDLGTVELFLVGTRGRAALAERGRAALAERGITARWTGAMPSHSPGVPKLADRIAQALYKGIAQGRIDQLDAVFSQWQGGQGIRVERRRLFPFDMTAFPAAKAAAAPLLYLAPAALLQDLTADYLHAQLCEAALHAFAAENEARMEAMAAARSQIERQLASLQAKQRQVRQEEITAEIIELAAGETASRSAG